MKIINEAESDHYKIIAVSNGGISLTLADAVEMLEKFRHPAWRLAGVDLPGTRVAYLVYERK